MKKGLIGKKVGMTQFFDEHGNVVPVTVIEAGPCTIVQKKTTENDGYEAVQLGFGAINAHRVNKPKAGHFAKGDVAPKRTLREFRFENIDDINVGDIVKADVFEVGEKVDITGISKGKGMQGVIKRHGFSRLKETHGTPSVVRSPGSIGNAATPGRVMKGTRLPGHMGHEQVTVQNLTVAKVDAENNLIAIRGAIPGPKGGIIIIANTVKNK